MESQALYHVDAVNTDNNRRVRMTRTPMTHRECMVNISKLTRYSWRTLEIVPASSEGREG